MTMNRIVRTRFANLATVLALGTLGLAACGSDPVSTGSGGSAGPVESSGSSSSGSSSSASSEGTSGGTCPAGKLGAEGSTAQANAISEVIANYNSACDNKATIEYNATGSGAGIKNFYGGLVDFAGSDSALKSEAVDGVVETDKAKERCKGNPAWNLPMVVGPIAFTYNLDGVDKLILNAEVLAKIFNGTVKTWNDPAIAALNKGATLPSDKITVFFRSDESGTTENVTKFLAAAGNKAWKDAPAKAWTGTGEGKNKSSGVAEGVTATKNSISYMEWSYAKDNKLKMAQIDNGAGATELTAATVAKAVSEATAKGSGNDLALSVKYTGTSAGAYPAVLVTYEIVCSKGLEAEKTAIVKDFLTYFASAETQGSLEELGYAPLPADLLTKVKTAVTAIQ